MTQYKVLGPEAQSIHGGELTWSLPTKVKGRWKPGAWHEVAGHPICCSEGLHLTTAPWDAWVEWDSVVWIAEGSGAFSARGDKTAFERARLLRPAPVPKWWKRAHAFVDSFAAVPWLKPDGKPLKQWRMFASRDAARDAAYIAARAAAWDANRDVVDDATHSAALYVCCVHICDGTALDKKHIRHAKERWRVWQKGYGLVCDVNDVLYVYKKD